MFEFEICIKQIKSKLCIKTKEKQFTHTFEKHNEP